MCVCVSLWRACVRVCVHARKCVGVIVVVVVVIIKGEVVVEVVIGVTLHIHQLSSSRILKQME